MLVLTRGHDKSILIGDDVEVVITGFLERDASGKWVELKSTYPIAVKLGIKAPRSVNIMRKEAVAKSAANVDKMATDRKSNKRASHR